MYRQEHSPLEGSARPPRSSQSSPLQNQQQVNPFQPPAFRTFDATPRFSAEVLVAQTQVPLITLRLWERNYGLPAPTTEQQPTKLYSQRDIEIIRWVQRCVTSTMSIQQIAVEFVRLEPTYAEQMQSPALNILLPPHREMADIRDLLIEAITMENMVNTERIIVDAFATYPAQFVCLSILQPVLHYAVELQRKKLITKEILEATANIVRAQFLRLIEACYSPKEASQYLATIVAQALQKVDDGQPATQQRTHMNLRELGNALANELNTLNHSAAQRLLEAAFLSYPATDVCLYLITNILTYLEKMGQQSEAAKDLSLRGIRIIQQALLQHLQSMPNLRKGQPIVVGCSQQETNETNALLFALLARIGGHHVHYLGLINPETMGQRAIRDLRPAVIYISAMTPTQLNDVERVGYTARSLPSHPIVCFGGGSFDQNSPTIHAIPGIYIGANNAVMLQQLDELLRLYAVLTPNQIEELLAGKLLTTFEVDSLNSNAITENVSRTTSDVSIPAIASNTATEQQKRGFFSWRGSGFFPGSDEIGRALPGLFLIVFPIAIVSELLWILELHMNKTFFVDIFIAAILAIIVGNVVTLSERLQYGLTFSTRWFLRIGILCYGLKFSYAFLLQSGLENLLLVLSSVITAIGVALLLGKVLNIAPRISALIGTGTAICGVSAVMATSPSIDARAEETGIALGTILFWGTAGLFLYPIIKDLLHLSPMVYGAWTGATIQDLPQLIATAQQGGGATGLQFALFVKLIRVAFLVLVVLGFNIFFRIRQTRQEARTSGKKVWLEAIKVFPLFVVMFFVVVLINTIFKLPTWLTGPLATWSTSTFPTTASSIFLMLAIIGLCGRVTRSTFKIAGLKGLTLGMITWGTQSVVVLTLASILFR